MSNKKSQVHKWAQLVKARAQAIGAQTLVSNLAIDFLNDPLYTKLQALKKSSARNTLHFHANLNTLPKTERYLALYSECIQQMNEENDPDQVKRMAIIANLATHEALKIIPKEEKSTEHCGLLYRGILQDQDKISALLKDKCGITVTFEPHHLTAFKRKDYNNDAVFNAINQLERQLHILISKEREKESPKVIKAAEALEKEILWALVHYEGSPQDIEDQKLLLDRTSQAIKNHQPTLEIAPDFWNKVLHLINTIFKPIGVQWEVKGTVFSAQTTDIQKAWSEYKTMKEEFIQRDSKADNDGIAP